MLETVEVPHERVLEILKQSSLAQIRCRLSLAGDENAYASALLHTDRQKSAKSTKRVRLGDRNMMIAAAEGAPIPDKGVKLELRFEYDNLSMVCYSAFIEECVFTDPHGVRLAAWIVEYPSELFQIQRRAFFRVRASTSDPVTIAMTLPGKAQDIVDTSGKRISTRRSAPIRQSKPKPDEVSGVLWDISGGGLSFTMTPQLPFIISNGAELSFGFRLPGIKEDLELKGRVVARKESPEAESLYCIEFIAVDSSARIRRSHNLIFQYIAKRERELLKELRMKKRWG